MTIEISRDIFEKYSNIMKIRPVGAELLRADRWTDMTKLIVAFAIFANAPTTCRLKHKEVCFLVAVYGYETWTST